MILTSRIYAPFSLAGERVDLAPGKRIAYDARSFRWIDDQRMSLLGDELTQPLYHGNIRRIFQYIEEISQTSDCERRKMACVVTNLQLSAPTTGVNKKPVALSGPCSQIGCIPALTCRVTTHAEQAALNKVPSGWDVEGHALFNTAVPCLDCLKICLQRNVKVIIYKDERDQPEYDRPILSALTMNSGIEFFKVTE